MLKAQQRLENETAGLLFFNRDPKKRLTISHACPEDNFQQVFRSMDRVAEASLWKAWPVRICMFSLIVDKVPQFYSLVGRCVAKLREKSADSISSPSATLCCAGEIRLLR